MSAYDIILSHGPVRSTKYLGKDTVSYILEDGRVFSVQFSIITSGNKKRYKRLISENGTQYSTFCAWDIFDEGLTCEDYAQWTADNFSEEISGCTGASC